MNKIKVLLALVCILLVSNVVLGLMLYRQNIQYDFLCENADQIFKAHFSMLATHLNTACPEDENECMMWVQEVKYLSGQCLSIFNLTSYAKNHNLQDIVLELQSIALEWREYPIGLIPRELAVDILELSHRLTDDEALLIKVREDLDQLYTP